MRRISILAVCGMLAGLLLAGCGGGKEEAGRKAAQRAAEKQLKEAGVDADIKIDKDKVTIKTEEGETTYSHDAREGASRITVTGPDGETAYYEGGADVEITEEELGAPIYPGAEVNVGSRIGTGQGSVLNVSLETADSFDKVKKFYSDQLQGKAQIMDMSGMGGDAVVIYMWEADGSQFNVTVATDEKSGGAVVSISRVTQ